MRPYTLERVIGKGAFGEVYAAVDAAGRRVAIKKEAVGENGLSNGSAREIAAAAIARDVPGIATVIDSYVDGDAVHTAVELYDMDLFDLITEERTTKQQVQLGVRVLETGLRALKGLHARGLLHLDVKPENFLYRRADGALALTDMGLAIYTQCGSNPQVNYAAGTLAYAAPEVMEIGAVLKESDFVSIALTALTAITQIAPDEGYDSIYEYFNDGEGIAVRRYIADVASKALPFVPEQTIETLSLCLKLNPSDRTLGFDPVTENTPVQPAPAEALALFEQLLDNYETFTSNSLSREEGVILAHRLAYTSAVLHAAGERTQQAYRVAFLLVLKTSGLRLREDCALALFGGGISGSELAAQELRVLAAVGGRLTTCSLDRAIAATLAAGQGYGQVLRRR